LEVKRVCSPHSYNIEKRCNTARRQIFMGVIKLKKGKEEAEGRAKKAEVWALAESPPRPMAEL
jgi:hypothetical protein